jgi:hypothetical protein
MNLQDFRRLTLVAAAHPKELWEICLPTVREQNQVGLSFGTETCRWLLRTANARADRRPLMITPIKPQWMQPQ